MRPPLLPFAVLALCTAAHAQDPLKSPACGDALAVLEEARASGDAARAEAARRQATAACLGSGGEARRPSPTAQPPVAVPPPTLEPPAAAAAPVPQPRPVRPVAVERPAVITTCDAGGCWDSEGRRLNRAGPVLLGPGGPCVASGQAVQCP